MDASRARAVRLLTVCGSLQQRSANRAALDVAATVAERLGAGVSEFTGLAELPAFNADRAPEPLVAVAAWRSRVAAAEAVVVAAPEYAGALAGAVKNAVDWLVGTGELYRKPVAVLSAGTTGGHHALRMLAQTLTWQGAYVVGQLSIAAPRTKVDPDGALTDPATLAAIAGVTQTLLGAPTMPTADLVALATQVVGSLGVDVAHVASAV